MLSISATGSNALFRVKKGAKGMHRVRTPIDIPLFINVALVAGIVRTSIMTRIVATYFSVKSGNSLYGTRVGSILIINARNSNPTDWRNTGITCSCLTAR